MKIIGFDVSSNVIGWGIVDGGVYKTGHCVIVGNDILDKMIFIEKLILGILNREKPDIIGIEDIIKFMGRNSSANTIITLGIVNRLVGKVCLEWGVRPVWMAVGTVRKRIGAKDKGDVPMALERHLGIKYKYVYKKNGKINKVSYDEADGLAVAVSLMLL